jgi:hypothetical protein
MLDSLWITYLAISQPLQHVISRNNHGGFWLFRWIRVRATQFAEGGDGWIEMGKEENAIEVRERENGKRITRPGRPRCICCTLLPERRERERERERGGGQTFSLYFSAVTDSLL